MVETLSVLSGKIEPLPTKRLHKEFEALLYGTDLVKQESIFGYHGDKTMTFAELNKTANKMARKIVHLIKEQKYSKSSSQLVIGIMMEPSIERFIVTLAVLKSGIAYVALDGTFPEERTGHMISSASVFFVVTDSAKNFKTTPSFEVGKLIDESAVLPGHALTDSEEIIGDKTIDALLAIFFTSGTTGKPKPVKISHRNVLCASRHASERYLKSQDEIMSHFFNFLSIAAPVEFATSLLTLTPLVIIPAAAKSNPGLFIELVDRYKITTILAMPPTFLKNLLLVLMIPEMTGCCTSLKVLGIGSEIVLPKLVTEAFKVLKRRISVVQVWGMTETTMMAITEVFNDEEEVDEKTWDGKLALGCPGPNNTVCIVDESMQLVNEGNVGQIGILGDNVTEGYFKESVGASFIDDVFHGKKLFLTGDYGCIRNGIIYFAGRKQTRVKVKGYSVNVLEIEEIIKGIEGVVLAAAFGYIQEDCKDDDTTLVAYYTTDETANITEESVKAKCEASLPRYAVPFIFKITEMPVRQPTGKINYPQLMERFTHYIKEDVESQPQPEYFGERAIVYALSTVLKIPPCNISMCDSFFDLGGDSQKATWVWLQLQELGYKGSFSSFLCARSLDKLMNGENMLEVDTSSYLIQDLTELKEPELEEAEEMFVSSLTNNRDTRSNQIRKISKFQYENMVKDHFKYVSCQDPNFVDLSFVIRDKVSLKILSAVLLTKIGSNAGSARVAYMSDDKELQAIYNIWKALASSFEKDHESDCLGYARLFAVCNTLSNKEASQMSFLAIQRMKEAARINGVDYLYGTTMMPAVKDILTEQGAEIINSIHLASFKVDDSYPFAHAPDDACYHLFVFSL